MTDTKNDAVSKNTASPLEGDEGAQSKTSAQVGLGFPRRTPWR